MKTLTCLRALFFRDVRTLFRSILGTVLGSAFLWFFLFDALGDDHLCYAVLIGPALCVPWILMKKYGGERAFPYPGWVVVLEKYLLGVLTFLLGLALVLCAEQISCLLGNDPGEGRGMLPVAMAMALMAQACFFAVVFAWYGREKVKEDELLEVVLSCALIPVCGGLLYLFSGFIYSAPQVLAVVIILAMLFSFTLSVRLYER